MINGLAGALHLVRSSRGLGDCVGPGGELIPKAAVSSLLGASCWLSETKHFFHEQPESGDRVKMT